ncbi:MAG: acyltransferase [Niabella sp.]
MSLKDTIKKSPFLKRTALWLMAGKYDPRPRWYIHFFINPFKHSISRKAIIRSNARTDTFPYNNFSLGARSIIEDFSIINNAVGDVIIGTHTLIGIGNVIIGPVTIGNNVMLAQHVVVSGLNHGYEDIKTPPKMQPVSCKQIYIHDDAWIGANAVITAGVTIGKHAVVAAGSIVTKDVQPYSIVAGNPAKTIKQYNFNTNTWDRI